MQGAPTTVRNSRYSPDAFAGFAVLCNDGRPWMRFGEDSMTILLLGLICFLGVHSTRLLAPAWRTSRIAQFGANGWKAAYSLVSLAGFVLVVYGFGVARSAPVVVWTPPRYMAHIAALLILPAFVLIACAYVPGTRIKAAVGHPMLLGIKLWAFAHLLANGFAHDILLFGAFLVWAVLDYVASRRRDRAEGVSYPAGGIDRDVIAIVAGTLGWIAFAFYLHGALIGVRPFG